MYKHDKYVYYDTVLIGTDVSGVEDDTGDYCIFTVLEENFRRNAAVNRRTCEVAKTGYVLDWKTTWKSLDTWIWNSDARRTWFDNLRGCEAGNNVIF